MLAFEKRVLLAGALIAAAAWAALRLGGGEILALFLKNEDPALIALSGQAMALFSFTYCTSWIGVCLSAFFTAVNRPAVSLLISLGRALLFPMAALAVLVRALGLEGVWLAPPVGNGLTALAAGGGVRRVPAAGKGARFRAGGQGGIRERRADCPLENDTKDDIMPVTTMREGSA